MMGRIFNLRLELQDLTLLTDTSEAGKTKKWNELTEDYAEQIAEYIRGRMSDVLKPGHKFDVGATGKAAENLETRPATMTDKGYSSFEIIEKRGYKANYFIRRGFRGTKSGRHIPIDKLKEWAAVKDVNLYVPGREKNNYSRYVRQRVGRGANKDKYYVRQLRKDSDAEAGLYALAKHLEKVGSKTSHWKGLYPDGAPRFDYVAYIIRQDKSIRYAMRRATKDLLFAYVDFVASGKRFAVGRIYDSGKPR